ncbi:L-histidine N(alpha)-methyltransferase [Patiriisocius hiemis]|uniref:L-histidine N(Alpha)-methyltransferase n=1 Tax=Patiriisocius hiemis TaxID=3075604 RepID=A0ABU2YE01_9FLAO|nr:L-histidine N(alpha)-methyltransferase [Constantimarinum sp. W242]MDT0555884.1 L-histidine N(alpha)-methyltransferase [Constantimarinum sp. W242]
MDNTFKKEVLEGLTSFPKYLSSKYIYDKKGDKLFQDIMAMPEYYLTNCEFEILKTHKEAIANAFNDTEKGFDLIELGAGDGKKTKVLLKHLQEKNVNYTYKPIDISQNAIDNLVTALSKEIPKIQVAGEKGEYFEVLERLKNFKDRKKVIMVLGSNIGNLLHPKAIDFLSKLKDSMNENDLLFMGFDQKKNPQTILDAYNDLTGITEAFNKNLLNRINKELGGNFNLDNFKHWEVYDPETGTAKSYLVATKEMLVTIDSLDITISFDAWETIHTEISQKYNDKVVNWLAKESGLHIEKDFTDSKGYYKNYLFKRKQ